MEAIKDIAVILVPILFFGLMGLAGYVFNDHAKRLKCVEKFGTDQLVINKGLTDTLDRIDETLKDLKNKVCN